MFTADFDFPLPQHLIAKSPLTERGGSRLMVLDRAHRSVMNDTFPNLASYLNSGDMLVLNNTRVLQCSLRGVRRKDGRQMDVLLVRNTGGSSWDVLSAGGYTGELDIAPGFTLHMERGLRAEIEYDGAGLDEALSRFGEMPIPPYLKRRPTEDDKRWYQTVYASVSGSIAAPTAGLHFTPELIARIEAMGVIVRYVTLHVGKGTFVPIRTSVVEEHEMLPERFEAEESLMHEIASRSGRLITVGTTTTRAIEAMASGVYDRAECAPGRICGSTGIFIYPGYQFNAVDCILTNFHLPCSTPLMLASAIAGREFLLSAYQEAVERSYRFFSYGDAMLII